jgi:hypothetical protein
MAFPNFLVIGAYKSGTTSLHYYLKQHPEIFIPEIKEPNYFAFVNSHHSINNPAYKKSIKSSEDYERLFEKSGLKKAIGEVSPEYLSNSSAVKAIHSHLPDVKLIAILRNPVERAYSDYLMYFHRGIDKESNFAAALSQQDERINRNDPTGYYISTGFYGKQLAPYYEMFPKNQIKIFLFEDLVKSPQLLLQQLFSFLNVDPDYCPLDLLKHNPSGIPKNALAKLMLENQNYIKMLFNPILPSKIRTVLQRYRENLFHKPAIPIDAKIQLQKCYKSDIHQLENFINRDLSHWIN